MEGASTSRIRGLIVYYIKCRCTGNGRMQTPRRARGEESTSGLSGVCHTSASLMPRPGPPGGQAARSARCGAVKVDGVTCRCLASRL